MLLTFIKMSVKLLQFIDLMCTNKNGISDIVFVHYSIHTHTQKLDVVDFLNDPPIRAPDNFSSNWVFHSLKFY